MWGDIFIPHEPPQEHIMVERVIATESALALIAQLKEPDLMSIGYC